MNQHECREILEIEAKESMDGIDVAVFKEDDEWKVRLYDGMDCVVSVVNFCPYCGEKLA